MEQKNIPLSYGIHRSPSLGNDGELSELVNLIPIRGELVNLQPPKDTGITVPAGDRIIHLHKTSAYTNYILRSEAEDGSIVLKYISDENQSEAVTIHTLPAGTVIRQVQSIGNTLVIVTGKGMEYVLFKEGTYKYIGSKMPDIQMAFSLEPVSDGHLTGEDIDLHGEDKMYVGGIPIYRDLALEIRDDLLSLFNPLLSKDRENGLFYAPFFVRYAYRTSLGDYTYISSPVLMVPNSGDFPFAEALGGITFSTIGGETTTNQNNFENLIVESSKIKKAVSVAFHYHSCRLLAKILNQEALQSISEDWSDIISGIDIFITHPQSRLNPDGQHIKVAIRGGSDYYLERPRGGYMSLWRHEGLPNQHGYSGDYDVSNSDWLILPQYGDKEYREMMEQQSVFRLAKSFNIDELNPENMEDGILMEDGFMQIFTGSLENIDTRPALDNTYDYHSRDTLTPEYTFVYNQRLNIANVKRYPYCPSPDLSFTYTDGYLDENKNAVADTYSYRIHAFMSSNGAQVKISGDESQLYNTPSWLFIPSSNVSKVIIERTKNGVSQYAELPMKEHPLLNGSYYIGNDKNFEYTDIEYKDVHPSIIDKEFPDYTVESNKIYTSEVGNPFVFPLSGINTVGLGEIQGIAAATKALSQGQFGQFPLYAFSTDGIWALQVGSTGLYESIHPVSRDVCTNPASITPIDAAIVFATEQGLKLLQGSDVSLISANMDGENTDESLFNVKPEFAHLFLPDTDSFTQMIATCTIAYDYSHNLLHIFPQGEDTKHYVYSLESGEYATYVGYSLQTYVPGYPQGIVQVDNHLCTFERYASTDLRQGVAVTKQLAFDAPFAMKVIHDIRTLRHRTADGTRIRIAIFVSNDGYHWARLRSLKMHSFKFYRIVLFSTMTDNDALQGVSCQFEYRRTNKLR